MTREETARNLIQVYEEVPQFGRTFAAAFMGLAPTLAIFFACSRYFVEGVTQSGGKE